VLSELLKISNEQRPKSLQKLENAIMVYLKKLVKNNNNTLTLIGIDDGTNAMLYACVNDIVRELVTRNKIFVNGTKILYLV